MKKQLLIAAVAATMTSVAFADISITGGSKVNYKNTDMELSTAFDTNTIAHDTDFTIVGKNGGTAVSMTFSTTGASADAVATTTASIGGTVADKGVVTTNSKSGGLITENVFMTSSIGDVNVKVGTWDNGDDFVSASSRAANKLSANTSIGGFKVIYDTASEKDDAVTVSGSFGGVNLSVKEERKGDELKVSTTVQGVTLAYHADNSDTAASDTSSILVSGAVSGLNLTYVQATADASACIMGDSLMGDFEHSGDKCTAVDSTTDAYNLTQGQDVSAMKISTAMAGNTVAFTRTDIDGVTGQDTSINKFVVTRPLASGATFEATYTDVSDDGQTTTDNTSLDLELAVKF